MRGRRPAGGRVTVYRVSHTGGHRFAPTAMTLPDGRMWAGIEAGEVATILDRTADAANDGPALQGLVGGGRPGRPRLPSVPCSHEVGWPLEDDGPPGPSSAALGMTAGTSMIVAAEAGRAWTVSVREPGGPCPPLPAGCQAVCQRSLRPSSLLQMCESTEIRSSGHEMAVRSSLLASLPQTATSGTTTHRGLLR